MHIHRFSISAVLPTLLAAIFLASCAAENLKPEEASTLKQGEGVVVFSVTHDVADSAQRVAQASFYIGPNRIIVKSERDWLPGTSAFGMNQNSDFEDLEGQLYVLPMSAGIHQIESWRIYTGNRVSITPKKDPTPLSFEVRAGQTIYIGNLHMRYFSGKNFVGMTLVGSGWPIINNMQQRDLAIYAKRYPDVANRVTVQLLPLGSWGQPTEIDH